MTIHIDVSNQQKMLYLVELLKSMDFVERIRIDEEVQKNDPKPYSFFEKHNGGIPSLDVSSFEHYVNETRSTWERDTY